MLLFKVRIQGREFINLQRQLIWLTLCSKLDLVFVNKRVGGKLSETLNYRQIFVHLTKEKKR
jgi:hypothetical protein